MSIGIHEIEACVFKMHSFLMIYLEKIGVGKSYFYKMF